MPKKCEHRCQQVTFCVDVSCQQVTCCIRCGYLLCCFDTGVICLASYGSFVESLQHV